jgi:hypothetical protein
MSHRLQGRTVWGKVDRTDYRRCWFQAGELGGYDVWPAPDMTYLRVAPFAFESIQP